MARVAAFAILESEGPFSGPHLPRSRPFHRAHRRAVVAIRDLGSLVAVSRMWTGVCRARKFPRDASTRVKDENRALTKNMTAVDGYGSAPNVRPGGRLPCPRFSAGARDAPRPPPRGPP